LNVIVFFAEPLGWGTVVDFQIPCALDVFCRSCSLQVTAVLFFFIETEYFVYKMAEDTSGNAYILLVGRYL